MIHSVLPGLLGAVAVAGIILAGLRNRQQKSLVPVPVRVKSRKRS